MVEPATKMFLVLVLGVAAATSSAAEPAAPYAGQESRAIKALDAEHVAGLLAGRGLGYAKVAELNRYPGPAHVLELAASLGLSGAQLESTRDIHRRMEASAKALGADLVSAEAVLDALFRGGTASPANVEAALGTVAGLQARLRAVHLNAHIEQRAVLTPEQVERYVRLRGYGNGAHGEHGHGAHGHDGD